ncbi:MAG TPA: hypothetical protein VFQ61_34545, partial [Polyangiaceae bacterium]|nr:hypothetical protein [Polyangiaceae bacterium]
TFDMSLDRVVRVTLGLLVAACHHDSRPAEGPMERAGRGVDRAAEKTGAALDKAAKATGKALGKAAHETGAAFERAGQKLEGEDPGPTHSK